MWDYTWGSVIFNTLIAADFNYYGIVFLGTLSQLPYHYHYLFGNEDKGIGYIPKGIIVLMPTENE